MSISNTSTIYTEGQVFHSSQNQGSLYMEVSYTNPLKFDNTLTITNSVYPSIVSPTQSNYAMPSSKFFMGSFDGFWVHKIYREVNLVMTVQGVNQDMFIPVSYDRIESVCMDLVPEELTDDPQYHPHVPEPASALILTVAAALAFGRKRFA